MGDSGYLRFNEFALRVDRELRSRGARSLHSLGLGDAGRNLEADFLAWQISASQVVSKRLGLPSIALLSGGICRKKTPLKLSHFSEEEVHSMDGLFTGEPKHLFSYKFNSPLVKT